MEGVPRAHLAVLSIEWAYEKQTAGAEGGAVATAEFHLRPRGVPRAYSRYSEGSGHNGPLPSYCRHFAFLCPSCIGRLGVSCSELTAAQSAALAVLKAEKKNQSWSNARSDDWPYSCMNLFTACRSLQRSIGFRSYKQRPTMHTWPQKTSKLQLYCYNGPMVHSKIAQQVTKIHVPYSNCPSRVPWP